MTDTKTQTTEIRRFGEVRKLFNQAWIWSKGGSGFWFLCFDTSAAPEELDICHAIGIEEPNVRPN